jgi:hypothetical protein
MSEDFRQDLRAGPTGARNAAALRLPPGKKRETLLL